MVRIPRDPSASVTRADIEQLLSDQATILLDAVDERMDKKLDPVITKLDGILKGIDDLKQENVTGAAQLRRHDDRLEDHDKRIRALELRPQQLN